MNKKLQALDAVKSLVVTGIKWTEDEFLEKPDTTSVETQTIQEILNSLKRANISLDNLMLYEKGLVDRLPVPNEEIANAA